MLTVMLVSSIALTTSEAKAEYIYCTYDGGTYTKDVSNPSGAPVTPGGGIVTDTRKCLEADGHTNVRCYWISRKGNIIPEINGDSLNILFQ